jgi:hypothetical protein
MKKIDLIKKCKELGISEEGTVKELKKRIEDFEAFEEEIEEEIEEAFEEEIEEAFEEEIVDFSEIEEEIVGFEYRYNNTSFSYKNGEYRVNGRRVFITPEQLKKRLIDHGTRI